MLKKLLIGLMLVLIAAPAMALELREGQDFWLDTYYDKRTYDESFPTEGKIQNTGGWKMAIFMENIDPAILAQIKEIRFEGEKSTIILTTPDVYEFLGAHTAEYGIWLGHKLNAGDIAFVLKGTDINDQPIQFYFNNGDGTFDPVDPTIGMPVINDVDALDPTPIKIKRMGFMRNGNIKVKMAVPPFTVPEGGWTQIRVRTFEDNNFMTQLKINPPYEIVKKNGDIVPDKIRVEIPASEAGRIARVEYRSYAPHTEPTAGGNALTRIITWFKLPDVEE